MHHSIYIKKTAFKQISPSEQTFINVLINQKKLERAYHALVEKVNDLNTFREAILFSTSKTEKFVKLFWGIQDPETSTLDWINQNRVPINTRLNLVSFSVKQGYVFFGGAGAHPALDCLAIDFPCEFEFGGIKYPSALHAFIAQTFPADHNLRMECARASKEELFTIALVHGNQCHEWYNHDSHFVQHREKIMYHIQDAKFGQHPEFLKNLLATIDTCLIYTCDINAKEGFWGAGSYGQRSNKMGQILMNIRGKYGGIGISLLPEKCLHNLKTISFKTNCLALDKEDIEIEKEIHELNASVSEEVYFNETTICKYSENLSKNRFNEYNYVYNKTLVPLTTGAYINANFMHECTAIGSQTPMPNTVEDFWHMVLDQKCKSVVMLNLPSDFAHFFYCPDDIASPKQFGTIEVRLLENPNILTHPSWTQAPFEEEPHAIKIRVLEIRKDDSTHQVTHYQYLNWRDLKIGSEGCVAKLVHLIDEAQGDSTAPIVAHCLAGVGRTAALLAIYDQYKKWKRGIEIDIPKCVATQRDPEQGRYYKMVQSLEQYTFIYTTLRHLISCPQDK